MIVGLVLYCATQHLSRCENPEHKTPESERRASIADDVLNLILTTHVSNGTTPKDEDKTGAKPQECTAPCKLIAKLLDDPTAFFTALLVYVVYLQLIWMTRQERVLEKSIAVANRAADAAKENADATLLSLRPWLTCETEVAGPLTYNEEGDARFQFLFEIKNVGHSPATAIQFTPFLTLYSTKHEPAIIRLQRMAQLNRGLLPRIPIVFMPGNVTIEGADLGLVLFPGEVHSIEYTIPIKKAELLKACEDTKPPINFWPVLGGLIAYSYALASIRADTAFAYTVEHSAGPVFKLNETIPVEKLSLSRSIFGKGFAT